MKVTRSKLIAALERKQRLLAKQRDELRDMVSDVEAVLSDVDEAADAIQIAIDALSRLQ